MRDYFLLLVILVGCDRPSPLGTFTSNDLSKWAADCEAPIVEENPREPRAMAPWSRDGRPSLEHSTRRFRCPPPGWAIYTDKRDRVVGLCVDDDTNSLKHQGAWISAIDRARVLITSHWGVKRAGEMLKGTTGDRCASQAETVAGSMLRWDMDQLSYPNPETIYSHSMCCWEVKE
jgi:hypothetical protein